MPRTKSNPLNNIFPLIQMASHSSFDYAAASVAPLLPAGVPDDRSIPTYREDSYAQEMEDGGTLHFTVTQQPTAEKLSRSVIPGVGRLQSDLSGKLPFLDAFLWYVLGYSLAAPPSTSSFCTRCTYRYRVPNVIVMAAYAISLTSVVLDSSGFNIGLCAAAFLLYAMAPATLMPVLRHLAPIWDSLYAPCAPAYIAEGRLRLERAVVGVQRVFWFFEVLVFITWLYYLWLNIYSAWPLTTAKHVYTAVSSALYIVYTGAIICGICLTVLVSRVQIHLHEVQMDHLLRVFRQRRRNPILNLVPPPTGDTPWYEFFTGLATNPNDTYVGRADTNSLDAGGDARTSVVPLTVICDTYLTVLQSIQWTGARMQPVIFGVLYTATFLFFYFFVYSFSGYASGLAFNFMYAILGVPLLFSPFARLNAKWEATHLAIERSLSMYTPSERQLLSTLMGKFPVEYRFAGLKMTYTTIGLLQHLAVIPPIVSLALLMLPGRNISVQ